MGTRDHWQSVYASKAPTEVSWYAAHLQPSLDLIREVGPLDARIIDVGGGASTLVDDLLLLGYRHLTVLDVSEAALAMARLRLADAADSVTWVAADITSAALEDAAYDLWHDRAVFHFLTREEDRRAYVHKLSRGLATGGLAVIGTFALEGPEECSGLPVVRYDPASLARELGPEFELDAQLFATHTTPAGKTQSFIFCRFRKQG